MLLKQMFKVGTVAALAVMAAAPANAAYLYSFSQTGGFFGDSTFTYTANSLITADTSFTPDGCAITGGPPGAACTTIDADVAPDQFGLNLDFLNFNYTNDGGGGSGYFFFDAGSLSTLGTYNSIGFAGCVADGPDDDGDPDCYGSAGDAVLVISDAAATVPEPATWASMIGGFALVGGAMRRRRRVTATVAFS